MRLRVWCQGSTTSTLYVDASCHSRIHSVVRQQVHEPSRDTEIFTLPPTWTSSMDEIVSVDSSVTLVKGPKKCGKSTAARTLVNKQLEKYVFISALRVCPLLRNLLLTKQLSFPGSAALLSSNATSGNPSSFPPGWSL